MRRSYSRNVWLYYGYGFAMNFAFWFAVWIKYLVDRRGLELKWVLFMDLPFWLIGAALQMPMGAIADRIGRRPLLILGSITYSLTILGFGFTTNYWMLFFDYVLWAVSMSMWQGVDSALIFDTLKQEGKTELFKKISGRDVAITLSASVVSVFLGGFVADWIGIATTVQLGAVGPLIAAGFAFLMKEPPIERVEHNYLTSLSRAVSFSWRHPQVRYTLLLGSVLLTANFGPVVLMQPFLIDHHVSTSLFGVFQAPLRLTAVVTALLAAWVSRKTETGRLIMTAGLAYMACYLLLALVDVTVAFALFALPPLVSGLTTPVINAHLNDRIESSNRATVLSAMQLCFSVQVAFFEPALGLFADDVSLQAAFLFALGYVALVLPPLVILWRRAHRAPPLGDWQLSD